MPYTLADTWKYSVELYKSLFKGSSSYGMNIFCNLYIILFSFHKLQLKGSLKYYVRGTDPWK